MWITQNFIFFLLKLVYMHDCFCLLSGSAELELFGTAIMGTQEDMWINKNK